MGEDVRRDLRHAIRAGQNSNKTQKAIGNPYPNRIPATAQIEPKTAATPSTNELRICKNALARLTCKSAR